MLISFQGSRGGAAPLTWGQRSVRRWIDWLGPHEASLNVPYVLPVPPGADVTAVGRALRHLVERHEALRTTYSEGGQWVVREGELQVGVAVARQLEDPAPDREHPAAVVADDEAGPR